MTDPSEEPQAQSYVLDMRDAFGGKRGMIDSTIPSTLFVVTYTTAALFASLLDRRLQLALWAALGSAAIIAALRLVRREPLRQVITGLVGVGIAAFIASRTGRPQDFYLPGLLLQGAYLLAYLGSIVAGWPLLGVIVGPLIGEGMAWRDDPPRRRAYVRASWVWVAMFGVRIVVQLPLYLAGQGAVAALGIARIAMGWPLFAGALWLSYGMLRAVPPSVPDPAVEPIAAAEPAMPAVEAEPESAG